MQKEKIKKWNELTALLEKRGYPKEFGNLIARELNGEKSISRMIGYLNHEKKAKMEDIVDEMLAICSERDQWQQKKISEYYNGQYNELLLRGLNNKKET